MNIAEFIKSQNVKMTAERVAQNPNMADSRDMDHWLCRIRANGRRMLVNFSMGYGHNGAEPSLADVLDCMASDAAGCNQGFESWCADYGYEIDSRKAEKTYKACKANAAKLHRVFGDAAETLIYRCERL